MRTTEQQAWTIYLEQNEPIPPLFSQQRASLPPLYLQWIISDRPRLADMCETLTVNLMRHLARLRFDDMSSSDSIVLHFGRFVYEMKSLAFERRARQILPSA